MNMGMVGWSGVVGEGGGSVHVHEEGSRSSGSVTQSATTPEITETLLSYYYY